MSTSIHPAQEGPLLSESTPVRLGLVLFLVAGGFTVAATAAVAHYRIGVGEAATRELKEEIRKLEAGARAIELRAQRTEDSVTAMRALLEKIDGRMERWERRGDVRPARGGQ